MEKPGQALQQQYWAGCPWHLGARRAFSSGTPPRSGGATRGLRAPLPSARSSSRIRLASSGLSAAPSLGDHSLRSTCLMQAVSRPRRGRRKREESGVPLDPDPGTPGRDRHRRSPQRTCSCRATAVRTVHPDPVGRAPATTRERSLEAPGASGARQTASAYTAPRNSRPHLPPDSPRYRRRWAREDAQPRGPTGSRRETFRPRQTAPAEPRQTHGSPDTTVSERRDRSPHQES